MLTSVGRQDRSLWRYPNQGPFQARRVDNDTTTGLDEVRHGPQVRVGVVTDE
jgi:hypothetical protein